MSKQVSHLAIFVVLVSGLRCTHLSTPDLQDLEPQARGSFAACSSGQGDIKVSVQRFDRFQGEAEGEWAVQNQSWFFAVYDPFGGVMLDLTVTKEDLTMVGSLVQNVGDAKIKDQFFYLDGDFIGIKAFEMVCFLKGVWPKEWLAFPMKLNGQQQPEYIDLANRSVTLDWHQDHSCAQVSWRNYLVFQTTIDICLYPKSDHPDDMQTPRSYVKINDEWQLLWESDIVE